MFETLKKVLSVFSKTKPSPKAKAIKTEKASASEIAEVEAMINNYSGGFASFLKGKSEKSCFVMEKFIQNRLETTIAIFSRISNSMGRKVCVIFFIRQGERKLGFKISTEGENSPSDKDILETIPENFLSEAGMKMAQEFVRKPSVKNACSGY